MVEDYQLRLTEIIQTTVIRRVLIQSEAVYLTMSDNKIIQ